jgi:hypothetical protein
MAPEASTPAPSAPSTTDDYAKLKHTLITASDLGKPWVQKAKPVDASPSASYTGTDIRELCPGHVGAMGKVKIVAGAYQTFSEGKDGAVAGVYTFTLADADSAALKAGYQESIAACHEYKTPDQNIYIVLTDEGPHSLKGADEVVGSYTERVYLDKAHKKLVAGSNLVTARTGRGYTNVSYNFSGAGKGAKDLATITRLMEKQLAETGQTFSS